jgi:hypothetical protein
MRALMLVRRATGSASVWAAPNLAAQIASDAAAITAAMRRTALELLVFIRVSPVSPTLGAAEGKRS